MKPFYILAIYAIFSSAMAQNTKTLSSKKDAQKPKAQQTNTSSKKAPKLQQIKAKPAERKAIRQEKPQAKTSK